MTDQNTLRTDVAANSSQLLDDIWRKEIHARVAGYRTRKGRRVEGAFSMRFPFPPSELEESVAAADEQELCAAAQSESPELTAQPPQLPSAVLPAELTPQVAPPVAAITMASEGDEAPLAVQEFQPGIVAPYREPEPENESRQSSVPRPQTRRKVIAFPRQASNAPEVGHRLADPVVPEVPRILDVPEELEAFPGMPLLDGLQLPLNPQPVTSADHVELPYPVVKISQRVYAGIVDCALVAASAVVFGVASHLLLPDLPLTKPVLLTAAAVPLLLWAIYEYIFMMYGGETAGMRVAKVRLATFKGKNASWRQRRSRVIGLYFSAASLAMGLLWALVDVDVLCWHDRISRTYLISRD